MADELDLVIQQLGLHPSATRIKKLLVYACRDRWESDAQCLAATDWQVLIQELRQLHPTLEHLRTRLDALVGTLNKQADYFPVVSVIADALAQFYPKALSAPSPISDELTQIETTAQRSNAADPLKSLQTQIVRALTQELDLDRLKKLLICAARQHWETDSHVLAHTSIDELITELRLQQPTLAGLQATLCQVVQNLSKPIEYQQVADIIIEHLQSLFINATARPVGRPDKIIADFEQTVPYPEAIGVQSVQNQTVIQRARENLAGKLLDLFDLRLEVMKATNPLRAKILLFSILYYDFNFQAQDWANLKLYSLDGLLRSVLKVCDTWDSLASNLQDVAQRQHDPDSYADVVTALLKCLKPAYTESQAHLQQVIKMASVADATQIVRSDATAIEINDDITEVGLNQDATLIEPPLIMTNWPTATTPHTATQLVK